MKQFFSMLLFASLLFFAACSDDDSSTNNGGADDNITKTTIIFDYSGDASGSFEATQFPNKTFTNGVLVLTGVSANFNTCGLNFTGINAEGEQTINLTGASSVALTLSQGADVYRSVSGTVEIEVNNTSGIRGTFNCVLEKVSGSNTINISGGEFTFKK